jgi:hypothetical protein
VTQPPGGGQGGGGEGGGLVRCGCTATPLSVCASSPREKYCSRSEAEEMVLFLLLFLMSWSPGSEIAFCPYDKTHRFVIKSRCIQADVM